MATDLPIRCSCGSVQGVAHDLSEQSVTRAVCYCDDCQSFAHYLGRAGEILDSHGGTEVYQMSPKNVTFSQGIEYLACVRLKPKGLYRWYADCCKTPLANTLKGIPFVGLIKPSLVGASNETLGPIKMRVFGRFAKGDRSTLNAHDKAPISALIGIAGKLLLRKLRGEQKLSPFFDPDTGQATVKPRVLAASEIAELERARTES